VACNKLLVLQSKAGCEKLLLSALAWVAGIILLSAEKKNAAEIANNSIRHPLLVPGQVIPALTNSALLHGSNSSDTFGRFGSFTSAL
jgi:hypothetical protein